MAQMNLSTKQKQSHRHREQTCCQGGGEKWGIDRQSGVARLETLTFRMDKQHFIT